MLRVLVSGVIALAFASPAVTQESGHQSQMGKFEIKCVWDAKGQLTTENLSKPETWTAIEGGGPPTLTSTKQIGDWVIHGQYVSMLSDRQFVGHVTGPSGERINTYVSVQLNGRSSWTQVILAKDRPVSVYTASGTCEVIE